MKVLHSYPPLFVHITVYCLRVLLVVPSSVGCCQLEMMKTAGCMYASVYEHWHCIRTVDQ